MLGIQVGHNLLSNFFSFILLSCDVRLLSETYLYFYYLLSDSILVRTAFVELTYLSGDLKTINCQLANHSIIWITFIFGNDQIHHCHFF